MIAAAAPARRVLLAGVLLAALVGIAAAGPGAGPAAALRPTAPASTPAQVRDTVRDVIGASRAAAYRGVRVEEAVDGRALSTRFDGTAGRVVLRYDDGPESLVTAGATFTRTTDPRDVGALRLAGRNAATWVRASNEDEGWAPPRTAVDRLFEEALPTAGDPSAATVTRGLDGSTRYRLEWDTGRAPLIFVVAPDGLLSGWEAASPEDGVMAFEYGPQRIAVPTDTLSAVTFREARDALTLRTRLRAAVTAVLPQINTGQPPTVQEIRADALSLRSEWNSRHQVTVHVWFIPHGARIWAVQPFSGRTVAGRLVLVKGRAVLR